MASNLPHMNRERTIEAINALGAGRRPFRFLISFDGNHNLVASPDEADTMGFYMEMSGGEAFRNLPPPGRPFTLKKYPPDLSAYRKAFEEVQQQIHYGNTFLLNLTFPTRIESNYSLSEIYQGSRARFKLLLDDRIVVFSPERFIGIRGNTIFSTPMKGTMEASLPGAYSKLLSDPKEDAEHNTIVDLIRNDLSMIASKVRVKRFKYVEKIKTHQGELLQMSSEVTGMLQENFMDSLGNHLFALLPAGSISGAPKRKTLDIIRRVEEYDRGFYTGIFGSFDGENLDSAVAIRYIEKQGDQLLFKSGGGITFQSECVKEYEELVNKVYVPVF